MQKSNDFQILLEWIYLPNFRWIDKIPFKLSSGQAYPSKKKLFLVMWPLWLVEMSLQHIQKNSPRLLHTPAKFEKNPPNGHRVIRKIKRGAGGAWFSPIYKKASRFMKFVMKVMAWDLIDTKCFFVQFETYYQRPISGTPLGSFYSILVNVIGWLL